MLNMIVLIKKKIVVDHLVMKTSRVNMCEQNPSLMSRKDINRAVDFCLDYNLIDENEKVSYLQSYGIPIGLEGALKVKEETKC